MKTRFYAAAFGAALLTGGAFGQYVRVDPKTTGFGTDVFYGGAFDRSTVVTFKARVHGFSKTPGAKPGEATDEAMLVAPFSTAPDRYGKERIVFADGYLTVELGPAWFVNDQATKIHVNDYVEITGSRMILDGRRVVMAQTVRHAHNILALRRLSGIPYWYAFRDNSKPNPAATASIGTAASSPPVADEQPATQNQRSQIGNSLVYGDAYPIAGSYGLVNGVFGGSYQRLQPVGSPLVIIGNTWYGGPQNGPMTFPFNTRF